MSKFDILYEEILENNNQKYYNSILENYNSQLDEFELKGTNINKLERAMKWFIQKVLPKSKTIIKNKDYQQQHTRKFLNNITLNRVKEFLDTFPIHKLQQSKDFQKIKEIVSKMEDDKYDPVKLADQIEDIILVWVNNQQKTIKLIPASKHVNISKTLVKTLPIFQQEAQNIQRKHGKQSGKFIQAINIFFHKKLKGRNDFMARIITSIIILSEQTNFN